MNPFHDNKKFFDKKLKPTVDGLDKFPKNNFQVSKKAQGLLHK